MNSNHIKLNKDFKTMFYEYTIMISYSMEIRNKKYKLDISKFHHSTWSSQKKYLCEDE